MLEYPAIRGRMTKRSKKPRDLNAMAAAIVAQATSEEAEPAPNPKAMAGRLGGLKGGPARAKKMSKERRSEIAKKAAEVRWRKS